MLHSNERMDLIIEYMTSYEEKIKMANKNGLFDAAKMFELFAIEVCNVWFGQKFSNLNVETVTYPYVDLISENGELEKIELIRQPDGVYRLDHAITANQKTILQAFGMDAAFVRKRAIEIADRLMPGTITIKI